MRGAIILCGGQSSRMGQPKALLTINHETLLARLARILSPLVHHIVIVAAPEQELPPLPASAAITIARDPVAYQGPLQGIAVGLDALPPDVDAAYISSVDTPLLKAAWVQFLFNQLQDADIAVPIVDDRAHPLSAVYRRSVSATAHRLLAEQMRRPIFLFDHHPTVRVTAEQLGTVDPKLDSLRNANTPEEFAELLERCRAIDSSEMQSD